MAVVSQVETPSSPQLQEFYELIERTSRGLGVLNVFKVMAHTPDLMRVWWEMMTALFTRLSLDPRLRELAVLRLFHVLRCEYGFAHHVRIGRQVGLTAAEMEALAEYESASGFSELERLVLRYTDSVTAMRADSAELARELLNHLAERDLVELTFCIANWNAMARLLTPLAVEMEPAILSELPTWWPK